MSDPSARLARWARVLLGWVMAASGLLFGCLAIALIVLLLVGLFRDERGGLGWAALIPIVVCACLAGASFVMARRFLRRIPSSAVAVTKTSGESGPKRLPPSMMIVFPTAACAAFGVWIGSAGGALSISAHPGAAVVGGLIGLLLGLGLYLDDRSVQRRLRDRLQGPARQPDTIPQPPEHACPASEFVALVMLAIPLAAGALIWQKDFFHLTGRAVTFIAAATVVSTALLAYIDARRLLLCSPGPPASAGLQLSQPSVTFCAVLSVWLVGYPAHFLVRRLSGAKNLIAPSLVATGVFLAPTFLGYLSKPVLPRVDSPDVISLVERAIIQNSPVYQARKDQIGRLEVREPIELSFDPERQRRVARAKLVSKLGEEVIFYTVEWQKGKKGMFVVVVYDKQP